jgi:hypothetical protein
MKDLEALGTAQNRKVYKRHGMDLELFGVSIANIKKLAKTYKGHFKEGLQLLKSGNHDAMYLSQYLIDPTDITKDLLESIALSTESHSVHETILANLGVMNKEITLDCITSWINHEDFRLRRTAWALYSNGLSYLPNEMFDEADLSSRLRYIELNIHNEENYVKYVMNGFVIAVGAYVPALTDDARMVAEAVGKVEVFMGETSCKVPFAPDYIQKIENMDRIGRKRKQLC